MFLNLCSAASLAADSDNTLSPSQWRDRQIVNAENRSARISNQLTTAKESDEKSSKIKRLESEQRVAIENIELAKALTIEDYFNVYLSKLSASDDALALAAKNMTEEEIATLLKILLKTKSTAASLGSPDAAMPTYF